MSAIERPKPGDDEEDLLRQQEEYFKKRVTPSVRVVNKRKCDQPNVSEFAKARHKKKMPVHTVVQSVLSEVKEKLPQCNNWSFSCSSSKEGFPEVFARNETVTGLGTSIFSQHVNVLNPLNHENSLKPSDCAGTENEVVKTIGSKSYILSGNDSMEIHQENVKKLSEMSMEEICAEQKKLKETLDPKLLQFLLSRRKKYENNDNCDMESEEIKNNMCDNPCFEVEGTDQTSAEFINVLCDSENKWLHMNVVEEEKLQWVGDIAPAEPVNADHQYNARFDFQGLLMPYTLKEIDVRQGLYHHGMEQQRPGYSIEELYQLSRSTVLQQRIIALSTIGNILEKIKKGFYDVCFNDNLLSKFLDHDLFLLLRFAIDENTEIQLVASLFALKNLLCSDVDELCLDRAMGCRKSIWQPCLFVMNTLSDEQELKESEDELKDYKMLKIDVIKGALRTDIILRIRYILEVLKPGPKATILCLEILTRIVRHSYESALAITCCPRLMKVIVTNFIPKNWSTMVDDVRPLDMQSVYNTPLAEALKLLRIIACHSLKLASDLVHKYSIMESVISYISIDPKECPMPFREVLNLILESFYIWQTFLAYNLATHYFIDVYPLLMRLLQFHYNTTSMENSSSSFSYEHGTALISLIEQAVHTSQSQFENNHHSSRTLSYCHVKDFAGTLEVCLSKWLSQLGNATDVTFSAMKLVGATFNCLASLYSFHLVQADSDIVSWLSNLESFCELKVLQYLKSEGFKKATASLQNSSCLLYTGEVGSKRSPASLPSLGALLWKGESLTPVLQPKSPIALLGGLLNFLVVAYTKHKGLNSKYVSALMEDSAFIDYIKCINEKASPKLASHWFARLEVDLLTSFLKITYLKSFHLNLIHLMAFKLVTLIQRDEKYLLHDVMSQIVFNADYFQNSCAISEKMAALQIDSSQSKVVPKEHLILMTCQELPALWNCYKEYLNLGEDLTLSNHMATNNLTATKQGSELFLPADWSYLPIIHLNNNKGTEQKLYSDSSSSSAAAVAAVTTALKWVFLVEELRPDITVTLNVTDKYCRLSTVFLCGSDLFLDPIIHELLFACFRRLMQDYQKIKFPSSFYEMYTQLLEQFAAVSYGDNLFGHFLLVPLQQRHSTDLRKQVWSEHAAVLRILSTPVQQLLFPVNEMLEPCEVDESLLLTYLHCLATGTVREIWCPVLYLTAMHHVATFINLHNETDLAKRMKLRISKLGNKELQSLLVNYKQASK
ncbi:RNA polymerase II-associated protein 1 [Gryllus bimaculatus]|nr:RNA polymerase II-associated protein 1 [Gryllus bimaculatus]